MKKQTRRLTLHRETLRNLAAPDLRRIAGATGGHPIRTVNATNCVYESACFCLSVQACLSDAC